MIILTASLQAQKGKEVEVEKILVHMVSETAQEEGALEYRLHKSTSTPGRFLVYEKYRDQSAIDAHVATPHYKSLEKQLDGKLEAAPAIELFDFIVGIRDKK